LLVKICLSKDPSFERIRDDCEFLNTFYIDTRYPVHWPTNFSDIFNKSQIRQVVKARALYCYLAKERCGMSGAQLTKQLGLTSGAISHLTYKGREFSKALTLGL
jgi:hypothetical protein